jgi:hypothetical protein
MVPELDAELYENLDSIYEVYSKLWGGADGFPAPYQKRTGKLTVSKTVRNQVRGDKNIVFYGGGSDGTSAAVNHAKKGDYLFCAPDAAELLPQKKGPLRRVKRRMLTDFAALLGANPVLAEDTLMEIVDTNRIDVFCKHSPALSKLAIDRFSHAFSIPCMCSAIPLAYLVGARHLIMGSAYEPTDGVPMSNIDGAAPEVSDSIKACGISFAEQDALLVRRSEKIKNIMKWSRDNNIRFKIWVCFNNAETQCGVCGKCMRTQMNILAAGENPKDWGFDNFDERKFSAYVRAFRWRDDVDAFRWDVWDSINKDRVYPFCNDLLQWYKKSGWRAYRENYMKYRKVWIPVSRFQKLFQFWRIPIMLERIRGKCAAKELIVQMKKIYGKKW